MALKRVHANIQFNPDDENWIPQVELTTSALLIAIRKLSGIDVEVKQLGAKSVGKDGRATRGKYLVIIPKRADEADQFTDGSAVAHAILSTDLLVLLNTELAKLSGNPSAIFDVDFSLTQALVVGAPGLIDKAPPAPPVGELKFTLIGVSKGNNFYDINNIGDIAVGASAGINWDETPAIFDIGAQTLIRSANVFIGARPVKTFLELLGAWTYLTTEVISDDADTPTTATIVTTIESKPASIIIEKDGVDISVTGIDERPMNTNFISRVTNITLLGDRQILTHPALMMEIGNKRYSVGFSDKNSPFKTIDSISHSLTIFNDTGSVINAGTLFANFSVPQESVVETEF